MNFWPRSLFGRLVLLLVVVVALAAVTTAVLFNRDRAALLARQFGETKIVQLKALRAALEGADGPQRRETLGRLGREYGVRIIPEDERPTIGIPAPGPVMEQLEARLREALGPDTWLRIAPRSQQLIIHVKAGDEGYWVGFPLTPRRQDDEIPWRAVAWALIVIALLLIAAYAFARYLARPLRDLNTAVLRVGRGDTPPPLPESGPSEIAAVNRGFNAMTANLRRNEQDRALLLAGVSHDLRTPLARLRLGLEVGTHDAEMREGMAADIEEMDKIIGQFLDFGRDDRDVALEMRPLDEIVAPLLERYRRAGNEVHYSGGDLPALPMRATAMSRLLSNLIDNALRYGGTPVDVSARSEGASVVIEVGDRGPGIPPEQVDRLKRPFTRGDPARSGASGAGLGLAIVERIARLHGARFDVLAREGGGTLARVTMPAGAGS